MLEIKNVVKKFGTKLILNNISLSVKAGEIAFLLGPSGVGKSTLLRVLNALETIDSGSLLLDGKPLISTHVGMVFQHFNLFDHMTVESNITFPLIKVAHKTAQEAHTIAHELLARYGLEDKAHLSIARLSGGQKQRLALARSIAMKPQVICLDEPTSALDPLLTNHVAQNIQDLARNGYIVLVASHDISLLNQLECMLYLMKTSGEIVEQAASKNYKEHPEKFPSIRAFVEGHSRTYDR